MKPERIEELLKGTQYEHKKSGWIPERHSITERLSGLAVIPRAHEDAELNAARVQLLAKALRDVILSESGELDRVQTAISIASQALHEAELNEQKEG